MVMKEKTSDEFSRLDQINRESNKFSNAMMSLKAMLKTVQCMKDGKEDIYKNDLFFFQLKVAFITAFQKVACTVLEYMKIIFEMKHRMFPDKHEEGFVEEYQRDEEYMFK